MWPAVEGTSGMWLRSEAVRVLRAHGAAGVARGAHGPAGTESVLILQDGVGQGDDREGDSEAGGGFRV
jgi:hypothetical protein